MGKGRIPIHRKMLVLDGMGIPNGALSDLYLQYCSVLYATLKRQTVVDRWSALADKI